VASQIDPVRVHPLAGLLLVEIDEILGGMTKGGLFAPPDAADGNGRKDTASGKVMKMGPMPAWKHTTDVHTRPGCTEDNVSGKTWATDLFPVTEGDHVTFPRDVPLVFVWNERRYGLVRMDEVIYAHDQPTTVV